MFYLYSTNGHVVRVPVQVGRKIQFGPPSAFRAGSDLLRLVSLPDSATEDFVTVHRDRSVSVLRRDGFGAIKVVQVITNEQWYNSVNVLVPAGQNGFVRFWGSQHTLDQFICFSVYAPKGDHYELDRSGYLSLSENALLNPWLYQYIQKNSPEVKPPEMLPYTNAIPGTKVTYAMIPIPGGEFMMGSPENEPGHRPDEGPVHRVKIEPFWMGKCEVTWNEYDFFQFKEYLNKIPSSRNPENVSLVDALSWPTRAVYEPTLGMGKDGYPAISMSHHAAVKYCQTLSALTGHFYRLPTEAEWEYACRAGTKSAYYFGDNPKALAEHAWMADNSDFRYHKVGIKKPNPWGLHDMYGNVTEWCLDRYEADFYQKPMAQRGGNAWNESDSEYPHVVRGGHWDMDDLLQFRSAQRANSDPAWNASDPQLPKARDFLSNAPWVGFRLVRQLKLPSPEEMARYWKTVTSWDAPQKPLPSGSR